MYERSKTADGRWIQSVTQRGYDIVRDPLLNKGTAFTARERIDLELEGILPNAIHDLKTQSDRVYRRLSRLSSDLEKYESVNALQDRNEVLFYCLLRKHLEELLPIIYTPTVGQATRQFSHVFRRSRGVWITPDHKGRIAKVLGNVGRKRTIKLMVVTDNESILGIGDQGAGGMAISVGKLSLYCAAAGIHPSETLAVSLDVGTENAELLDDPLYLGYRHRRLRGQEYDELVHEFVAAAKKNFPGVLLQWEDFRKEKALRVLDRYVHELPSFNDDIQGTGAVGLAAINSALRITGAPLTEQRILILGAGAAGLGMARQIRIGLAQAGLQGDDLAAAIAVIDSRGLLIDDGGLGTSYKLEMAWSPKVADRFGLGPGMPHDLDVVMQKYRPTVLIGSSGQPGAFTKSLIQTMAANTSRPVILPFSNPTSLSEARPADLYKWTDGRAFVATGSPFADVEYNGKTYKVGQGNNAFIFPGLGLGTILAGATEVTAEMISAAALALSRTVTDEELAQGSLFPAIGRLREVSLKVACAVIRQAVSQKVGKFSEDNIEGRVEEAMWKPEYPEYIAR